jgi:Protein of unknown function (DUF3300)
MRMGVIRALTGALALLLAAQTGYAQDTPPPMNTGQNAPVFNTEELDQILAPIALYPDQLLAQVLMASTYPLEIVQAERWAKDPNNAKLTGDPLAAAIEQQSWDPSVKSLVPFPQVLQMMNEKLDWTQKLGDAFLAHQQDVMNSVQRLRKQAQAAGMLNTTEQQVVKTDAQTIVIQPANPQIVYVPTYNPTVVYGTWPYPAYPPYYYPPPPAYYPGSAFLSGMAFAAGVAVVGNLWGWGNCNWGYGNVNSSVNVNVNRYNQININNINAGRATTLPANSNGWRHDPNHRKGVAYRDPVTRQQYLGQRANPPAAAQNFRGFAGGQGAGATAGQRPAGVGTAGQRPVGAGTLGQRPAGARTAGQRPAGVGTAGQRPAGGGMAGQSIRPAGQSQQFNAFSGMGSGGAQVRTQANRGSSSRQGAAKQFKVH